MVCLFLLESSSGPRAYLDLIVFSEELLGGRLNFRSMFNEIGTYRKKQILQNILQTSGN